MKKVTYSEIQKHLSEYIKDGGVRCEKYNKINGVWKFLGWYSPLFNGADQLYNIKACRDAYCDDYDLWLITNDNRETRYRISAKDKQSYDILLGK